jgi:hypothetical protein
MFDKLAQMAEEAATSVSRRRFLGHFGTAAALALVAGGVLARSSFAQRLRPAPGAVCDGSISNGACNGRRVGDVCGSERRKHGIIGNCYCADASTDPQVTACVCACKY